MEAFFIIWAAFGDDAFGERSRGFEVLDVVEELEGLHRRVAAFAAGAALFAVGRVEVAHEGRRGGALEEAVKAAAVERRAVVLQVVARVAVAVADGFPDVWRLVGAHTATAHFEIDETADKERVVADLLGIKAHTRPAGEQTIFGIEAEEVRFDRRGLFEGFRHQKLLE